MDCSPLGSSVHGFLQARMLEWVAMPSSRGSSPPRDPTFISYISLIGRWFLPLAPPGGRGRSSQLSPEEALSVSSGPGSWLALNKYVPDAGKGLGRVHTLSKMDFRSSKDLGISVLLSRDLPTPAHRPPLVVNYFCSTHELKMVLIFLNGWGKKSKEEL